MRSDIVGVCVDSISIFDSIVANIFLWQKEGEYKKENSTATMGQVVFFGDSITDYCDLEKYYPEFTCYNRGISGYTTVDLFGRMKESIYDLKPSVVVLLIGVNDINNDNRSVEDTFSNVKEIITLIKADNSSTKIIVQSIYPTYDGKQFKTAKNNDKFVQLNALLEGYCEEQDCVYVDIHKALLENGELNKKYSDDGLHPNAVGYELISGILTPIIREYYSK